ncbi:MAG: two-component system, OmpR family, sensor kinase [Acidimicrobiaceae bacterium]|nr:two-component system, OmpR family, sensor kinase [Acidimicrobiaceae bacterium]
MQRRLTTTIIGVVVGAIFLTGAVTFALAAHAARNRTRTELSRQAVDVAAAIKAEIDAGRPALNLLRILRTPLKDENDVVLVVAPGGQLIDVNQPRKAAALPAGLTADALHPDRLLQGQVVSGTRGQVVYAAAPYQSKLNAKGADLTQVVVLTRNPATGIRQALPWFLLSAALVLAVAALVGDGLGRRISRPLRDAETVTRRIAAGDLTAQVPLPDHAYPELESLAHSINRMTDTLARSKGLERQFLLSVSHDLRTPLTSIRGYADAIAEGAAPDNARAGEIISSEARRLERLVQDLLDLARFDARRFDLHLRPIDVAEVVADAGEGFRPAAEELGLRLDVAPTQVAAGAAAGAGVAAIVANADPDRLAQVVANLVENALKYAQSRVQVAVASSPEGAIISVDDDGPGIAADDLPRVFDRLFISSRYPARQVGTGLGLAIVAELVAAMGGAVRAESPTGGAGAGGTRVVVTLPMWSSATAPTMSAASPSSPW